MCRNLEVIELYYDEILDTLAPISRLQQDTMVPGTPPHRGTQEEAIGNHHRLLVWWTIVTDGSVNANEAATGASREASS
jgi:hypothetical protein